MLAIKNTAKTTFFAFILSSNLLLTTSASSTELFEINTSVRGLGMGNAYTSVVRDSDSLFYNPAGLALDPGVYWTIADPRVGLNGVDALTSLQSFQDPAGFGAALTALYGKKLWAGGGGKSAIRFPYFAAAVYTGIDSSLAIDDPATPVMEVNYINDFGYAAGFGAPILPFMYFGLAARQITRTGNRTTFDAAALATLDSTTFDAAIANKGTGLALDAGITFSIDAIINPTLAFVVKNVGGTTFSADAGVNAPPSDEEEWVAGASITTDLGLISFTPSIDVKHLNKSDVPLAHKVHVGAELGLPLIDLRFGFHQSYWAAGVGLGLGPLQVDAASYGVELGDENNSVEDRRYVIQATIEFGLDLGFAGGSSGGRGGKDSVRARRRRGLKQRR